MMPCIIVKNPPLTENGGVLSAGMFPDFCEDKKYRKKKQKKDKITNIANIVYYKIMI